MKLKENQMQFLKKLIIKRINKVANRKKEQNNRAKGSSITKNQPKIKNKPPKFIESDQLDTKKSKSERKLRSNDSINDILASNKISSSFPQIESNIKTRSQLRWESNKLPKKVDIKSSEKVIAKNNKIHSPPKKDKLKSNLESKNLENYKPLTKKKELEEQKQTKKSTDISKRKRDTNERVINDLEVYDEIDIHQKMNSIISFLSNVKENIEQNIQYSRFLKNWFEELNEHITKLNYNDIWTKEDFENLKQDILSKLADWSELNTNLKKREAKELSKEKSIIVQSTPVQYSLNPSLFDMSPYIHQNNSLLISAHEQTINHDRVSVNYEEMRFIVTPKLWQILNWTYIPTKRLNEYPGKFIHEELIKYWSRKGIINNNLIDATKDSELKLLGYTTFIHTNQLIWVILESGLIERVKDI